MTSVTKNRNDLLRFFTERNFSPSFLLRVSERFIDKTEDQKEQLAQFVLRIISDCRTEEEAIEHLITVGFL